MTIKGLPWEQAANQALLVPMSPSDGQVFAIWVCCTCKTTWSNDQGGERAARYCCAIDRPCQTDDCPGRTPDKHRLHCKPCSENLALQQWLARPEMDWNGESPLSLADDDRYFFDADELEDFLREAGVVRDDDDEIEDGNPPAIENFRFEICRRVEPRRVCLADYVGDDLSTESAEAFDTSEIDAAIEAWLEKNFPECYEPTKFRASIASIKQHLRLEAA